MSDKIKFPRAVAQVVAEKIVQAIKPMCLRVEIAGSIRRKKASVGDIEIVFIPRFVDVPDPLDLLGHTVRVSAVDLVLQELIERGSLAKRHNVNGSETWGASNKLAVAVKTGIPVDLFATDEVAWFNYLVCRTGSAELNTKIASAAQAKGWKWHPTSYGFERTTANSSDSLFRVRSERDVFEFVGLPYLEPEDRSI